MAGRRRSGFAKLMDGKRREDNAERNKAPKGFDISLGEFMSKYNVSDDQVKKLGELTATRRSGLAHATIDGIVWYRERQLVEMLADTTVVVNVPYITVDECTNVPTDELLNAAKVVGD